MFILVSFKDKRKTKTDIINFGFIDYINRYWIGTQTLSTIYVISLNLVNHCIYIEVMWVSLYYLCIYCNMCDINKCSNINISSTTLF